MFIFLMLLFLLVLFIFLVFMFFMFFMFFMLFMLLMLSTSLLILISISSTTAIINFEKFRIHLLNFILHFLTAAILQLIKTRLNFVIIRRFLHSGNSSVN